MITLFLQGNSYFPLFSLVRMRPAPLLAAFAYVADGQFAGANFSLSRFADDGRRYIAPAGCARAACTATLAATHAGTRQLEILAARQIGIVVCAMARVPPFAKAAKKGHLDSDANPDGDDDEYDPARDVHVRMLA